MAGGPRQFTKRNLVQTRIAHDAKKANGLWGAEIRSATVDCDEEHERSVSRQDGRLSNPGNSKNSR
jgi:hypothetical protein